MTITSILLTGIQGDEPVFNASIFRRDISTGQIFVTPEAMTYWHGVQRRVHGGWMPFAVSVRPWLTRWVRKVVLW